MRAPKCRVYATSSPSEAICRSAWTSLDAVVRNRVDLRQVASFDRLAKETAPAATDVLVVSAINDLPLRPTRREAKSRASSQRRARYLLLAGEAPAEVIGERLPALRVQDPRRLLVTSETDPADLSRLVARCLRGIVSGSRPAIVSAVWEFGDEPRLVVTSATFERLRVPLARLQPFLGGHRAQLVDIEIDADGSYLYWPHADAHFGWEQFAALVDPARSLSARIRQERHHQKYGRAMRAFRETAGLRQADITGIDARTAGRVERGEMPATSKTLAAYARAHALTIDDYLAALAERVSAA